MAGIFEDSQEDRTEKATSFRREEFRKQGVVAQSREVLSVAIFFAGGMSLYFIAGHFLNQFRSFAKTMFTFSHIEAMTNQRAHEWMVYLITSWAWMVGPLFAVVMTAGLLAGVAQVGFHVSAETLAPNWERLNPVKGFGRLFSLDSLTEAAKAIIKMVIVFAVAWVFLKGRAFSISHYFQRSVPEVTQLLLSDLMHLFFILVGALACFAAFDFLYQHFRIEKQMRMTKQEVKEEYKLREGDPILKSRIRNTQRRIARRRMMEAVPKADVVITNPTHFSVALQYDPKKMRAPKVVAKGMDFLALKIRELAKSSGVPIVENKPLARALYRQIPVGKVISEDLYTAVAQVLTYVYRLKAAANA